uniref:AlNc14C283G10147 protein n=1 Tax=Albugo laibachii Nc14 TaxID=890382 RepID=F0WV01_9STRA|nr:AlNc14C283G10147 [Albugo laibachii Nc14]|eukprot:CCA25237.1 AlNc14C283G10147 [Albugo laibachii Nc14]
MSRSHFPHIKNEKAQVWWDTSKTQRFNCLKCDSTQHSVRNCPSCVPGEAELLLKQRRVPVEKRVEDKTRAKKAAGCGNSGEVMASVDGVENIKTLLDSGSDCRIVSMDLVDTLSSLKFLPVKELTRPLKTDTVVGEKNCTTRLRPLQTSGGPLVWRNLEVLLNEGNASLSLLLDRNLMERMGYSVETVLDGAREKKTIWNAQEETIFKDLCLMLAQQVIGGWLQHSGHYQNMSHGIQWSQTRESLYKNACIVSWLMEKCIRDLMERCYVQPNRTKYSFDFLTMPKGLQGF